MIIFLLFIFSLYWVQKNNSVFYFLLFHFVILLGIGCFYFSEIEAAFQISNRPSDTHIYYAGYYSDIIMIKNHLFYEYPLMLKILSFPINNVLYAVYGQSLLVYLLLDIIIKEKSNLVLFIFSHTLIFTIINLFKDNYILIVILFTFIILKNVNNNILKSIIVLLSVIAISWIRPFFFLLIPLSFFPLMSSFKSKKFKVLVILGLIVTLVTIIILNLSLINYIIEHWSEDASVQDEKSAPPLAFIKVFLGPSPFHYLFPLKHFVQPILWTHAILFFILHIFYYVTFSYFVVYVISNWKTIFGAILYKKAEYLYMFIICSFLLVVYILAYGSADIRQRALIITCLYIYVIPNNESIIKRKLSINQGILLGGLLLFMLLITCLSY